jgi:NAD(P)-dependent dehydrogenase (short-subunit alcohol dehydrogenase family)
MPSAELAGKTAIVTGGTSGIGRAIVESFCRNGANVLFTGRSRDRGMAVAATTGAVFFAADAASGEDARRIVERTCVIDNRVDILVNNAGDAGIRDGVEKITADKFDKVMAVHLRGPWLMMAAAIPVMRHGGGGCIINMSSVAAHRIGAYSMSYSVAKAGLLHLTRCAAAELGKDRIRVNSISPGFIATPIHARAMGLDEGRAQPIVAEIERVFVGKQALSRTGLAQDVAAAALFLAGDQSGFMTGTDLVVDGGLMWGKHGIV